MVDTNLLFASAQALFGNGTTVQSTNWLSMKVAQDNAAGNPPEVEITITTTFSGGTSVDFQLCAVDAAGANPVVIDRTGPIAIASLTAPAGVPLKGGTVIVMTMDPQRALPAATLTSLRVQAVNVGNNTAGAATIHLLPKAATTQPNRDYPGV